MSAPAARPNPNPGPKPRPRASAGAVTVVAAIVATVARIANAFFMRMSSLEYPRTNADTLQWLQGGTGFWWSRGPDADAEHISDWIVPKKRKMARQRNLALAGTNPALRSCLVKCSNLERGESMKDPVSIFGCWRGFSIWGLRGSTPLKERSSLRRDRPRLRDRR